MIDPALLLPPPHREDHRAEQMWVDEQIWGHRLWDSQSPWLLFLEFLNVAEACHRDGRLLDERGQPYPLTYRPRQRLALRNILFNDDALVPIAAQGADDATAWTKWLKAMADRAVAMPTRDFSYLRGRFRSFRQFAALVTMLRGANVEGQTNRRWGSRFVFPFGPSALYEDLNLATGSANRDYINFGRTGELLYMMLCRSSHAAALQPHVAAMVGARNPWNSLLALLQPGGDEPSAERGGSFLPYRRHAAFDRLAQDWLAILELRLPGFDAYPHLVVLGALHVMLYQLETADAWRPAPCRPHFVCELVAPRKTLVRELSILNYQQNDRLSVEAVEACIRAFEALDEWRLAASGSGGFARCRELLNERFRWPRNAEDYEGCSDPGELITALRRAAVARHRQHGANVHRAYGRDVGLVSKRGTTKLRYAPNDSFLKALVFANVEHRMEYREFLAVLFHRYGLVFDARAADRALPAEEFDEAAFEKNAERLEQRLASLGLLRRLSDACAYVQNPFQRVV